MSAELKDCAFCNGPAIFVKHSAGMPGTMGWDSWHAVACKACGATIGAYDRRFRNRDDAAKVWNARSQATPDAAEAGKDAIPEGWKLVPIEPTPEMCAAAQEQYDYDSRRGTATVASNLYRAMVEAAPGAPGQEAAAVLATFAHEILMGAIRPAKRIKAARTALERAGMLSLETVVAASASRGEAAAVQAVGAESEIRKALEFYANLSNWTSCSSLERGPAVDEDGGHKARRALGMYCPHCDDTGDVHSIDGEWRGRCTCPAGAGEKTS